MSLKLDELRKRLLQQSNPEPNAGPAADTPASVRLSETGRTSEIKDVEDIVARRNGYDVIRKREGTPAQIADETDPRG